MLTCFLDVGQCKGGCHESSPEGGNYTFGSVPPSRLRGDSYRRQIQQAIDYCAKHNLELDEKAIEDTGVSGFRGSNWTDGALGRFIEAVKSGAIAKGSYLLVESMDRLSRHRRF